jgi:hypothetical protein
MIARHSTSAISLNLKVDSNELLIQYAILCLKINLGLKELLLCTCLQVGSIDKYFFADGDYLLEVKAFVLVLVIKCCFQLNKIHAIDNS